jgi:hypothetical protein
MAHQMTHYSHTDARYTQLDAEGRRCDGNNRRCTQRAIEQHWVRRCDPETGKMIGDPEEMRTCGRHRQQFVNSALWHPVSWQRMTGLAWPHKAI